MFGFKDMSTSWVNFCHLPEKGRKEIEEIVEEMKERNREERRAGMKVKKLKKNIPSSTITYYRDSWPCPTVSQYQLDALVIKPTRHLCTTQPPQAITQERGIILSRKKLCVSYFFMRNPNKNFQNSSMHVSKITLCIKKHTCH